MLHLHAACRNIPLWLANRKILYSPCIFLACCAKSSMYHSTVLPLLNPFLPDTRSESAAVVELTIPTFSPSWPFAGFLKAIREDEHTQPLLDIVTMHLEVQPLIAFNLFRHPWPEVDPLFYSFYPMTHYISFSKSFCTILLCSSRFHRRSAILSLQLDSFCLDLQSSNASSDY